jgi:hypothetical protein
MKTVVLEWISWEERTDQDFLHKQCQCKSLVLPENVVGHSTLSVNE